jgi:hypothetical protein
MPVRIELPHADRQASLPGPVNEVADRIGVLLADELQARRSSTALEVRSGRRPSRGGRHAPASHACQWSLDITPLMFSFL